MQHIYVWDDTYEAWVHLCGQEDTEPINRESPNCPACLMLNGFKSKYKSWHAHSRYRTYLS